MTKAYKDIREEYLHSSLDENTVTENPFEQFKKWMDEAIGANLPHPTSMLLATAGSDGQPACRVVLLKNVSMEGFEFYTNYSSRKGQQLSENPKAALTFFWMALERQVRIEGKAEKIDNENSDAYFNSRPFESRLSAAVSPQSKTIKSRQELEAAMEILSAKHPDRKIPRPENWGGFILKPHLFEFWQGRENRLHDRICFTPATRGWTIQRIAP
jgi:pyridoxamine 5'-phosphate oxidase